MSFANEAVPLVFFSTCYGCTERADQKFHPAEKAFHGLRDIKKAGVNRPFLRAAVCRLVVVFAAGFADRCAALAAARIDAGHLLRHAGAFHRPRLADALCRRRIDRRDRYRTNAVVIVGVVG
ncbi:hypothetical protein ACVIOG_004041 [Rhizobium leguminosarum]